MATSHSEKRDAPGSIDVSIIVVSYNTREMTLECLRSVVAQSPELEFEVLFIDNQSTDGSFEAVESEFGSDVRFQIIASDENLGFARANNVMAKQARGSRILLLNPDTVVLDHALEKLNAFADERSDCGIWGGRTVQADGVTLDPRSCWADLTLIGVFFRTIGLSKAFSASEFFNPQSFGEWQRDSIRHVGYVTGCLLLIDRSLWERLNGFAPEFFMYGEEAELCVRAKSLGAKPIITPEATIIHYVGASATASWQTKVKVNRGEITLMRLHWSKSAAFLGRELIRAATAYRAIVFWVLSKVRPNEGSRSRADDWKHIWAARSEWLAGYESNG
jgi:GT2 family glycosyltransferase